MKLMRRTGVANTEIVNTSIEGKHGADIVFSESHQIRTTNKLLEIM